MMNCTRYIAALCCSFALAACIPDLPRVERMPGASTDDAVFAQIRRIHNASAAELNTQEESLQKAYAGHRNEQNRLRLALFLAVAPAPMGDRARALTLFDVPPGESTGQGRNHPLAQMFIPLLQDYHRLDEALGASQQKQRELQQNNDQMRQKLEALRDIETRIQERPKAK